MRGRAALADLSREKGAEAMKAWAIAYSSGNRAFFAG